MTKQLIDAILESTRTESTKILSATLFERMDETDYEYVHRSLILEDRLDFLKNQFKNKIDFTADHGAKITDSDALIDHIANKVDPSVAKVHTSWVAKQYKVGDFYQEDFPRVKKALKGFELTKKNLAVKDLNQFKSLSDLEDHVAVQKPRTIADVKEKEKTVAAKNPNNLEKVFESDHGTGYKVPSKAVSTALYGPAGKLEQTRWCTAAAGSANAFHSYSGGKYTFHTPENNVLQIHHGSGQIMDKTNTRVNLNNDPRFSPHKEAIKDFIKETHLREGGKESEPSPLMKSVGVNVKPEDIESSERYAEDSMSRSYASINRDHINSLTTNPHTPGHFSKVMDFIHKESGPEAKGSYYDDHYMAANALASNPHTPSHILDDVHEATKPNSGFHHTVNTNLAANPSISEELRSKVSHIETFGKRSDLRDHEIDHIVKNEDKDSSLLHHTVDNHLINISPEHQKLLAAHDSSKIDTSLSTRPDIAPEIADHLVNNVKSIDHQSGFANVARVASPDVVPKLLSHKAYRVAHTLYNREDLTPELHEQVAKSGQLDPAEVRPEHGESAAKSGNYKSGAILNMKGVSKDTVNKAASDIVANKETGNYVAAYKHPSVTPEIKSDIVQKMASSSAYAMPELKTMPSHHIDIALKHGTPEVKKSIPGYTNVQKPHFDELAKDPTMHGAIVASKSAPPSVLTSLANSPSDYIRSMVKKHKNTPTDVKNSISYNEDNV